MARSIWRGTINFGYMKHLPHLAGRWGAARKQSFETLGAVASEGDVNLVERAQTAVHLGRAGDPAVREVARLSDIG